MITNPTTKKESIDLIVLTLYCILVVIGCLNVYSASFRENTDQNLFEISATFLKQFIWILFSLIIAFVVTKMNFRVFENLAYHTYLLSLISLIIVLLLGATINGSTSWIRIGNIGIQPSEFAKLTTLLALARFLSSYNLKINDTKTQIISISLILTPALLIILQGDTGTSMVFMSFLIVLYLLGFNHRLFYFGFLTLFFLIIPLFVNSIILIFLIIIVSTIIIALMQNKKKQIVYIISISIFYILIVTSVDIVMNRLKPYQQKRIMSVINPQADPLGIGWNVTQSKIAIGSGGFLGKGFLNGTQTQLNFVPAQTTDFIFTIIGEEFGWIGTSSLIIFFIVFILRILYIAERQKLLFSKIYGYGVACILFFHFSINIAMTIGLFPVIGIPLPFFSYGGSSFCMFTILLFILLNLDAHKNEVLTH